MLEHDLHAKNARVIEVLGSGFVASTVPWIAYLAANVSMPTTLISQANSCEICRNELPIIKVYTVLSNGELDKHPWPVAKDHLTSGS